MNSHAMLSHRSRLVDAANTALPIAYKTGVVARPQLDSDAILSGLMTETGLDDFGGDWFRKPLDVLLAALRDEADLNALGRFGASGQLRKVLKDRLHAQHLLKVFPEIERRSLARPVIVVGPMRSGTTRLHRLLAADTRFAHMRSFETINPVPAPDFQPGKRDGRWMTAQAVRGLVYAFNPTTAVIHPSGAFEPEEELGLLVRSIWSMKHEVQWNVPSYGRWSEGQDATPAYRYMARLLRLIGWARGDADDRPWVLKTPQHMLDLPALMQVFPDARIIFTHRNPQAVVGSSCSLVWNQMIIHSDKVCSQSIGREWLRKTDLQITRMRKARVAIPTEQRLDVHYADMERDWTAVMRDIYGFLDLDIEPALPAMADYMADSGKELNRHPHRYSLEAFGLTGPEVAEHFKSYTDAFDLRRAAPSVKRPDPEPSKPATGLPSPALTGALVEWDTPNPARAAAGRR